MDIVDEAAQANEKRPENAIKTGIMCQPSAIAAGKSPKVVQLLALKCSAVNQLGKIPSIHIDKAQILIDANWASASNCVHTTKKKVALILVGLGLCPTLSLKKEMIAVKAKPSIVSTKPIMKIPNTV